MGENQQKVEEAAAFRCFLSLLGQPWEGLWSQPDPPAPDILVSLPEGLLGVEISGLFHDDGQVRILEGEQRQTLEAAKQLWRASGAPEVEVHVHWLANYQLTKNNRQELAAALVSLVRSHMPPSREPVLIPLQDQDDVPLVSLRVWRTPEGTEGFWRASRGSFPPPCDPAIVQAAMDMKADRAASYRQSCRKLWLLVTANHSDTASWCTDPESIASHSFIAPFDRAFLLWIPSRLVELRLSGRAAA